MTPAPVARGWALALAALGPLAGWPELQALAGRVVDALAEVEGLSPGDLRRLRAWPARWRALRPEVRAFYARARWHDEIEAAAAHLGLLGCLDGRPAEPWVRGCLARLHRERMGFEAPAGLAGTTQRRPGGRGGAR